MARSPSSVSLRVTPSPTRGGRGRTSSPRRSRTRRPGQRQDAKRSRVADISFPGNQIHATLCLWLFARIALPASPPAGSGAKVWSETKIPLGRLQGFEINQNGQRNLWKSLEKKARNLEMFGAGLEKLARPDRTPPSPLVGEGGRRSRPDEGARRKARCFGDAVSLLAYTI